MRMNRCWRVGVIAALLLALQAERGHAAITTPHDSVPDFCASPTIQSVSSGRWSSPATWSPARVPTANDRVLVAAGKSVVFDVVQGAALQCVGIHGQLTFDVAINTKLWAGEVMVYSDGDLQIGTTSQPIPAHVTAEIVIANKPLNTQTDPDQYGTAFLSWGGVTIHGAPKQPTFVRTAVEPKAGQTTIVVEQPVTGWRAGDLLIVPDTRHLKWNEVTNWAPTSPQWEERTLQSVSADGRTLTLASPLQFDHLGARDAAGALTYLPHVANLTRNVIVRSESASGSSGTKGHVLFTHEADIDVRYARFMHLGRTTTAPENNASNHTGRYSLHIHHMMGPQVTPANGYQFTLIGNAVDGGSVPHDRKWGLTVHNSHYGLLQDNVGYNYGGAVFMFEDGSESYNVVDHNFAMRTKGTGDRLADGTEGVGFWFRGPNNYIRRNVAANHWGNTTEAAYGFKFFMRFLGNIRVPNFKGADTSTSGEFTTKDGNKLPILEFSDNEVYGAAQGMTYWWVNSQDPTPNASAQETVIKNLHIWHVFNVGVYHYPAARMTFDGLVIRGKDPSASACCGRGWFAADYAAKDIVIRNANIQGMQRGIITSEFQYGTGSIENSYFRTSEYAIAVPISGSVNNSSPTGLPAKTVIVRNTRFDSFPGATLRSISAGGAGTAAGNSYASPHEIKVYDYQGNSTGDFQVYWTDTRIAPRPPANCVTASRPEIGGIPCDIQGEAGGDTMSPAAPTNVQVTN